MSKIFRPQTTPSEAKARIFTANADGSYKIAGEPVRPMSDKVLRAQMENDRRMPKKKAA